jgi:hypothetical protein
VHLALSSTLLCYSQGYLHCTSVSANLVRSWLQPSSLPQPIRSVAPIFKAVHFSALVLWIFHLHHLFAVGLDVYVYLPISFNPTTTIDLTHFSKSCTLPVRASSISFALTLSFCSSGSLPFLYQPFTLKPNIKITCHNKFNISYHPSRLNPPNSFTSEATTDANSWLCRKLNFDKCLTKSPSNHKLLQCMLAIPRTMRHTRLPAIHT